MSLSGPQVLGSVSAQCICGRRWIRLHLYLGRYLGTVRCPDTGLDTWIPVSGYLLDRISSIRLAFSIDLVPDIPALVLVRGYSKVLVICHASSYTSCLLASDFASSCNKAVARP